MLAMLGGAGWLIVRARHANQQRVVLDPDLLRLTSSNDAALGAIAPDGSRIAFAARLCDAVRRCTFSILVQDVGRADTLTLAHGATAISGSSWSPDGRFLLIDATFDGVAGSYLVSTIAPGALRLIGCCRGHFLVNADSVLLTPAPGAGNNGGWLRIVTAADGKVRDSVRTTPQGGALVAIPSPNGRWLATHTASDSGGDILRVTDRHGLLLDSIETAGRIGLAAWADHGHALLYSLNVAGYGDSWDIIYQRIDSSRGRRDGSAEPLLHRPLAGGFFGVAINTGEVVFADGPRSTTLISAQRPDLASISWKMHPLKEATGVVAGLPSPDGRQVLLSTTTMAGRNLRAQLSMMPFDSGAERTIGAPINPSIDWNWFGNASAHPLFLIPGSRGKDQLVDIDPVSGVTRVVLSFPDSTSAQQFEPLAAGSIVTTDAGSRRIVVLSADGSVEREIPHPLDPQRLVMATSPDGADLAVVGYSAGHDSLLVHHVHLADGMIEPLVAFPASDAATGLRWLVDGSIVAIVNEPGHTTALYSIRGTAVRRLGVLPWGSDARYQISADGLRLVVALPQSHADLWLIRNFGRLLPH
jgi:hypothetical protein